MAESILYHDIDRALALTKSEIGAAECHGMFCGVLCANGQLNVETMASHVLGGGDQHDEARQHAAVQIGAMLSATMAQLQGKDFNLRLLLPEDDVALAERSAALGLWCQGFVTGLSAGGVTADTKLNKDANELLLDFTNIARTLQNSESLADVGGEEETAYAEVEEYVRVGVMLINEELRALHPEGAVH